MGSTGRNILIGCAAAIGAAALLAVGSCIGFTVWLNRPGHLMEPEKLLGADTTGFIEWTLRREDPGTLAILETFMENNEMLPMVAAWTVRPGDTPGSDLHLLTVSLPGTGNRMVLADWMLGLVF